MTTNGVLLKEQLPGLMEAGLDAVNISLDTLDAETFRKITRRDELKKVLEGEDLDDIKAKQDELQKAVYEASSRVYQQSGGADAQAAEEAELPKKALVVAQTTIRRDRFDSVLQVLRRRVPDLTQRITICAATSQRQQEAEKLSGEADVMVVVGGKNSSNTQKLLETCRLRCKRSILVETPEDVPQNLAKADDRVALTAGASTPQWLLEQVRARIEENAK